MKETLELFERRTTAGQTCIAVKCGLMLVGIVWPLNIVNEKFVTELEQITRKSKIVLRSQTESEGGGND
jgi:hypothetical protein